MEIVTIDQQSSNKLRNLAINTLITIFIIMCYFYFSEIFGSISTPYIYKNQFEILFGPTLFLFSFFSILTGPVQSFISGFLGEFFYQLAFYDTLTVYWFFIIGFFGAINSLYKYKPLKYKKKNKIWYTFFILIINSIVLMISIVIFQIFLNTEMLSLDDIILNFGTKLLIQSFLSFVVLVPILLLIYDKLLAKKERHLYYLLLTHHPLQASDHTFTFHFGRTYIYFCSRCSGMIIGLIMSIFAVHLIHVIFNSEFNSLIALTLIIILPIPGLIDWGTQRLLLRTSSTSSRIFTGFIIGVAMYLMPFTRDYYFISLIIIIIYFSILFILIYVGQKRLLKQLNKELVPQPPDEKNEHHLQ